MRDDEQGAPADLDGGQPGGVRAASSIVDAALGAARSRALGCRPARRRGRRPGQAQHAAARAGLATGARGEERVARQLQKYLKGRGVVLLHDRRIPGTRANIDHIAIGPGGVTVIDTKNYKGKVRAETRGGLLRPRTEHLVIHGRDQTKLIDSVLKQVELARTVCAATDVRGALCMANVDGLPMFGRVVVAGVAVDGPKRVAALARRPGSLSPDVVEQLAGRLAVALPPA